MTEANTPDLALPSLADYQAELLLPDGFAGREVPSAGSCKVQEVLELQAAQSSRRFLLGVLMAYIAVAERLLAHHDIDQVDDVLTRFPNKVADSKGKLYNTLTFEFGGEIISLRTMYNAVEHVIRHDLNRPHYPNSAPHATQSWAQHSKEFEIICSMQPGERTALAQVLWDQVLAIPEMASDVGGVREVRPFELILEHFPSTARGEPGGAVLQGLAYAYYRADSPSVTLRVFKVGSGSSRVGAAGDVDGWTGGVLALSVEVKDYDIASNDLSAFDQFVKQLRRWPNCTAVALARSFTPEAEGWLRDKHILAFDRDRMASNVAFWDLPKQRMAVREMFYFLNVIQGHVGLRDRFTAFCDEHGISNL